MIYRRVLSNHMVHGVVVMEAGVRRQERASRRRRARNSRCRFVLAGVAATQVSSCCGSPDPPDQTYRWSDCSSAARSSLRRLGCGLGFFLLGPSHLRRQRARHMRGRDTVLERYRGHAAVRGHRLGPPFGGFFDGHGSRHGCALRSRKSRRPSPDAEHPADAVPDDDPRLKLPLRSHVFERSSVVTTKHRNRFAAIRVC